MIARKCRRSGERGLLGVRPPCAVLFLLTLSTAFPLPVAAQTAAIIHPRTSTPVTPCSLPISAVRAASALIGVPYSRGGASHRGMDCSGLVYRVFEDAMGLALPRNVDGLFHSGSLVRSPMHIGDLLFFDTSGAIPPTNPTHVVIYTGRNTFVHSASEGQHTGVIASTLENLYYRERFLGARRVIPWRLPALLVTVTDTPAKLLLESPFASRETLKILVSSEMSGGGPLEMTVLKNGEEILWRRIFPTAKRAAEVSLVPDIGEWTVRITRIFKGRELHNVAFTVEE
jgi:probable lipoprotein NlpC